jgi:hypothetical protein
LVGGELIERDGVLERWRPWMRKTGGGYPLVESLSEQGSLLSVQ